MDGLQKRVSASVAKERGQYVLAFGIIASILLVANYPVLVIFFFAVFAYLLLKIFSAAGRSDTRDIFEFYLTSNEILRDDERRWFGFEIQEAIARGESISRRMISTPPLVLFAVGALYNKIGDHRAAVTFLTRSIEGEGSDERAFVNPSPELRNYVRVLRKIERDPADAPLTSNAVRTLERARKIRGKAILEESKNLLAAENGTVPRELGAGAGEATRSSVTSNGAADGQNMNARRSLPPNESPQNAPRRKTEVPRTQEEKYSNRKSISEVLHDIYDAKAR